MNYMREYDEDPERIEDISKIGYGGVLCIETGGPTPGLGCAGRGIIATFSLLEDLELFETYEPDVVLYDVLGDVAVSYTHLKPREAYPFPNTTFSELYKKGEEEEYLEYRDSLFCKEIHRKFPVFVIDWREDVKEGKRIVNDIFYLPEFTFEEYDASAKEVYESTIKAFEDGDENEFIKMGDGKDFHIRPGSYTHLQ